MKPAGTTVQAGDGTANVQHSEASNSFPANTSLFSVIDALRNVMGLTASSTWNLANWTALMPGQFFSFAVFGAPPVAAPTSLVVDTAAG